MKKVIFELTTHAELTGFAENKPHGLRIEREKGGLSGDFSRIYRKGRLLCEIWHTDAPQALGAYGASVEDAKALNAFCEASGASQRYCYNDNGITAKN